MAITISGDSPNFTSATLTTSTLTSPTITGAVVSTMASSVITAGTAVASTSGTSIDFTGIPSWVKRITVMFSGVSTSGSSFMQIQLGTGSPATYTTTGYVAFLTRLGPTGLASNFITSGIAGSNITTNTDTLSGLIAITNLNSNTWTSTGNLYQSSTNGSTTGGSVSLAAPLTAVRITTVNGTDTFDAGSVNILYE